MSSYGLPEILSQNNTFQSIKILAHEKFWLAIYGNYVMSGNIYYKDHKLPRKLLHTKTQLFPP